MWFSDQFNHTNWFYLGIYFLLGCIYAALTFMR